MNGMHEEMPVSDEMLNSPSQRAVRAAVAALPEDSPSLAWRSSLNEQLRDMAGTRQARPRWMNFLWAPAAGLALAGALAVVMLVRSPMPVPRVRSEAGIEATLVRAHLTDEAAAEVAGAGLRPEEALVTGAVWEETEDTPSEVDLQSL